MKYYLLGKSLSAGHSIYELNIIYLICYLLMQHIKFLEALYTYICSYLRTKI